jgi:hypothetical protein
MRDYLKTGGQKNIPKQATLEEPYILPFDAGLEAYMVTNNRSGPEAMVHAMMVDALDEINAAKQFCMILHCKNVQTETMVAPVAVNKKRQGKGKSVLFDYHVLTLNQGEQGSATATGHTDTGRATPRQHLRRGHIRRLENRVTWVNATIVGNQGFVSKDYRISGGRGNAK